MNITIKGGIYFDTDSVLFGDEPRFVFFGGKLGPFNQYAPMVEHTIVAEVPPGFSAQHECIAALERRRDELRAKFAADVRRINEQIANLQAITA